MNGALQGTLRNEGSLVFPHVFRTLSLGALMQISITHLLTGRWALFLRRCPKNMRFP